MITIEEGAIGGFGSQVLHHLAMSGLLDHGLKIRTMVLPDVFLDHDSPQAQYDQAGLNARHIVAMALVGARPRDRPAAGTRLGRQPSPLRSRLRWACASHRERQSDGPISCSSSKASPKAGRRRRR